MSSTGRSLLDAHSGDTLNLADTDSDEDAAINAYGKRFVSHGRRYVGFQNGTIGFEFCL